MRGAIRGVKHLLGKNGLFCEGGYTWSKACTREKVGLSVRGTIRGAKNVIGKKWACL